MRRTKGNSDSSELKNLARRWISLWCVPTDWELFDRLHADDFEDGSPAGRETSKNAFAAGLDEFLAAFPDRIATAVEVRPGRWKSLSTSLTRRLRAVFFIQCIVISSAKIHANFMPEHMNHVVALKMSRHR
jgi:hypothetical protein